MGPIARLAQKTLLLEQGANGIGGLSSGLQPVLDPFLFQHTAGIKGNGIVVSDLLDEPTIPRVTGIRSYDSVKRLLLGAVSL